MQKLSILIFLLFSINSYGQNLFIKGSVFERIRFEEHFLERAQVEILNENDIVIATTETNKNGRFRTNIQNYYRYKQVKIVINSPGYNTHRSVGKFQVDGYDIELFPLIKDASPPVAMSDLPQRGQDVIILQRQINQQNSEIEKYRLEIENLRNEKQRLLNASQTSEITIAEKDERIKQLEELVDAVQKTKEALLNEKGAMKKYVESLESENDSLISTIERMEEAERIASKVYINKLEVYAADDRSKIFSDKPNRVNNFDKWTRTIVVLNLEKLNGDALDEPIRLILRIKHIESDLYMKYAEGDGNDSVVFYYEEGEKQIVFSNYESKNRFYGSDSKFVAIIYIDNGNTGLREIHKTRLTLKN